MQNKKDNYNETMDRLTALIQHAERMQGLLPSNDEGFCYVIGQRVQVALDNLDAALQRVEAPRRPGRTIAELNADSSLDDLKILWTGATVQLMRGVDFMTTLDATADIQDKITRWCDKNNYRCSQMHDGKIWL